MNGLLIQWLTKTIDSRGGADLTFMAFSNTNYVVTTSCGYANEPDATGYKTSSKTPSSCRVGINGSISNIPISVIIIGY